MGRRNFQFTLDVGHFSPDELTVKTQGRRLIVMGKHDKKRDTEDGSYFHEYREWKREAELPEDVNPEQVVCSYPGMGTSIFRLLDWHCQLSQRDPFLSV
ncbi:hypothetical protein GDO86_012518 [Hymenochirus boettgeri]|uniref:SHSP domain-containing protein n=1 Tax=Hymenochirus boettgeri TaxID=247094 RepID=A0A8T2IUP1_9PIPI|nr:hypothetical protein GDO86_012518 [Hymenochirus boettgeri]